MGCRGGDFTGTLTRKFVPLVGLRSPMAGSLKLAWQLVRTAKIELLWSLMQRHLIAVSAGALRLRLTGVQFAKSQRPQGSAMTRAVGLRENWVSALGLLERMTPQLI
jgi:hypothetical protein